MKLWHFPIFRKPLRNGKTEILDVPEIPELINGMNELINNKILKVEIHYVESGINHRD